ncbi:ankyrin repeat-containing protein [Acanthamoeba castellanii str. Neff]|uniref:Ankyrin repeat-containing protein n=1 Tax=Acanthamoeba castellanii (strain ATCC 30010 / Neff) TaxID=1257118 RepID=L8H8U5_ACACF|nr:ankyrin repeat-containing protein [Acanthamoeba castellanii str. Neff]ELR21944.1 ankyrin repeat-containing protein [Acanthamoeba castellanii str. Neff]
MVESFPNVETLALACAELESLNGKGYFSLTQELSYLTNLKHLDISYVPVDKSDESLATNLNLKTLISIQETGPYGNRPTRVRPHHRDAMTAKYIFAQGGLDDQSLVSSVTNPACFDLAGRTLLHRAADDPKRIAQLRQLVDESGHVDAPLAAGLDNAVGVTDMYNRFIHSAKRRVSDRLGGLSFPSPVSSERRNQATAMQTRPMLLTPQAEAPGSTALHIACTNDNHEAVAYLLAKGADVNAMNDIGQTPLMLACHYGNLLAVSALVATGRVLINLQDNQLFELLFGAGANVNQPNYNGFSALHLACMARNPALVVYLLSRGASVSVGISPLFCLAGDGELSVFATQSRDVGVLVDVLVDAGCPVNAVNETGKTLLHVACQDRDADLAEALLRHADVDVNLADAVGWAERSLRLRCRPAAPPSPPRPGLASMLLSRQANVNATATDPRPEEDKKEKSKVVSFMRKLIKSGADVNAKDARGWTALHAVCASSHLEAVGLLLAHGANVNARDFKYSHAQLLGPNNSEFEVRAPAIVGRSGPIQRREQPPASEADSWTICKLLLGHGAQFDVVDEVEGETALHLLTRAGTGPQNGLLAWAVVQLKDHGVFHLRNAKGETLLHSAIACNNSKLVSILLQHGADKSLRSHLGETALHTALRLRLQSATRIRSLSEQPAESCDSALWPTSAQISPHQAYWPTSEVSEQNIVALVARGLTEEECTARDCFGLTALHWAVALGALPLPHFLFLSHAAAWLGANAPRATQDKSLSRLAVLSLFIVNHILTHFKDRVMDAVDERGDTALHRLAEMRRITTLMAVSSQASLIVRAQMPTSTTSSCGRPSGSSLRRRRRSSNASFRGRARRRSRRSRSTSGGPPPQQQQLLWSS